MLIIFLFQSLVCLRLCLPGKVKWRAKKSLDNSEFKLPQMTICGRVRMGLLLDSDLDWLCIWIEIILPIYYYVCVHSIINILNLPILLDFKK